mgnify:FL=1
MMIGSGAVSSDGTARHVEQQAAPLPQTLDYRWRFNREVLLPMADQFFEARFESEDILRRGVEDKRQIIFVGNHSGGSMSWDNVVFQALFDRVVGCEQPRLRRLIHPRLYHDSIAPFRIREWWKEMGCVEATYDNFDALLSRGERFLYLSPEGVDGLKKPTWRAKRLRPFSSSFVSMAKRHDALVVPVVIHNSQYLNPLSWTWKWLDALADKLFGWPFLPLGPALPLIFFAKFFIQAWPTRLTYEFLEPISFTGTDSLTRNRHDAQAVRFRIEDALGRRKNSLCRATHWRALFDTRITFWNTYRFFFEAHAGRPIRATEQWGYAIPVLSYLLAQRATNRAAPKGRD